MQTRHHEWVTALTAWSAFVTEHPELGYASGKWQFHNFLRHHRERLVHFDAIRRAKNRFWIAHISRFTQTAFDCATGTFDVPAMTRAKQPGFWGATTSPSHEKGSHDQA